MKPSEMLKYAAEVLEERGAAYGEATDNFQLVADLATLRLGREVVPYEVAIIMVCLKQARLFSDPLSTDSRIDCANYELLASLFVDDYVKHKSETQAVITYKKREDLHKAEIKSPIAEPEPFKAPPVRGLKPLPRVDVQEAIQSALGKLEE
jgi:hypothetical protein